MEDKIIFEKITDSFVERERLRFTYMAPGEPVPVVQGKWDKLLRRPLKFVAGEDVEKHFVFGPTYIGTMYRIAGRALSMPEDVIGVRLSDAGLRLIHQYIDDILYILAAAIQNDRNEPSAQLIDELRWNLELVQVYEALRAVIDDEEMKSFLNSINLVKGTISILKPELNPMDGSE